MATDNRSRFSTLNEPEEEEPDSPSSGFFFDAERLGDDEAKERRGPSLAEQGTEIAKGYAKEEALKAAGKVAGQAATGVAKKAAVAALGEEAVAAVGLAAGAEVIVPIIVVIVVIVALILVVLIIILAVANFNGQTPSFKGTTPIVAMDGGSSLQNQNLSQTLGGGKQRPVVAPPPTTLSRNGRILPVPGVGEGRQGQCGVASILMVILYINPNFADPKLLTNDASNRLAVPDQCVAAFTINNEARRIGSAKNDWFGPHYTDTNMSKDKILEAVKRSIAGGDPVVMAFRPGGIYDGSKHIVTVVGYDPDDKSYYINNPYPGGVSPPTNVAANSNRNKLTFEYVKQYLDNRGFGSVIIRKVYLP